MNHNGKDNVHWGAPFRAGGPVDGGGGPPHDKDMERRVASLETKIDSIKDTLSVIQVTLAEIKSTMATKEDVAKIETRLATSEATMATEGDIKDTRISIATLDERTKKLATTRSVAGMLLLVTGIIALIAKWSDVTNYFLIH